MYVPSPPESSKVPIAPMGKLLTRLPQLSLAQLRPTLRSTTVCTCRRDLEKFPLPRWDFHMFCACLCLQGGGVAVWGGTVTLSSCTITGNTAGNVGGVYVLGGTVTFSSCTITGNTAFNVRTHAQNSHQIADALASILACATANASVNNTVCMCHRDLQNFPSPLWENC